MIVMVPMIVMVVIMPVVIMIVMMMVVVIGHGVLLPAIHAAVLGAISSCATMPGNPVDAGFVPKKHGFVQERGDCDVRSRRESQRPALRTGYRNPARRGGRS
jgi:hypothetical protein